MLDLFIKKLQEFILEKEEEMAKKCAISPKEVEDQILKVLLKIKETKESCQEEIKEFDYLLTKLNWIKAEAIRCQEELLKEIKEKE